MNSPGSIARLKITLSHVEPAVLRRIEVPLAIKLSDLHLVIQAVMPWWNYHLYQFEVRKMRWGLPDPDFDWGGPRVQAAKAATLADLLAATGAKSFKYVYDFGDDWQHEIRVEKLLEPETGTTYPRLLDVAGRCPPEDVGGPWGYQAYLEAISDPSHENHAELIDWRGPGFDPNVVDRAVLVKELEKLAKRWARRAAGPAKDAKRAAKAKRPAPAAKPVRRSP
ncbi:MAG: plasmid pRiA4b ORF-3 family protein [Pseudomonadota bacterium]